MGSPPEDGCTYWDSHTVLLLANSCMFLRGGGWGVNPLNPEVTDEVLLFPLVSL